jgi:anti-anti-sigma factor
LPPALTIDVRPDRDRVFVAPRGAIDHFSALELRAVVQEMTSEGWSQVVLDLRQVDFMDAGGLHLLQDARDGRLAPARFTMVDGVGPVALPLAIIGGERLLPAAEVAP